MSSIFGALIEPVELIRPSELGPVHFIAIGGAGMSGVAALYAELGIEVSGSDQADSPVLADLAARGIRVHVGHAAEQLGRAGTIVVSSAIRADNPELVEARARGLRVWHRSAALGALMLGRPGVSVTGTHGKTTTSGMLAHLLTECGADPGYVIGAALATSGTSFRLGSGPFVVEADESDGSFRQYPADIAVITNVEADHLDNWGTPAAYLDGFRAFAAEARHVVAHLDDPGVRAVLGDRSAEDAGWITFGEEEGARVRIDGIEQVGFRARARLGGEPLELAVPGRFNVGNAAAAVLAAHALGVDLQSALAAIKTFRGTARRFTPVGTVDEVDVVDDYAHHPTEVAATLEAARDGVEGRGGRVIACFQPHLFSRTRDFADEFGAALALADEVVLMDIYPAREDPIPGVTSDLLVTSCAAHGRTAHLVSDRTAVPRAVADLAQPGDVVLTLGAGDVTRVGPQIVEELRARSRR
ncbi:UDP-N-acetylmuramate--L-alanine ligase [Granulicoccus sp. GXG6511]|uniref:UDP-N-acetylmuramate--L-alanine ligase n=1 Tax=Granulicoccus sp. GXG6511 TaxID=3381351 RepID=UPI003D7C4E2F